MIRRFSESIVAFLDRRGALKHSSKEVYVYGFDIAIYTYLSTLGLFFIGWIGGYPIQTILLIALYYSNQSLGGGYHASTHMRCFLTMALGMMFFLFYMSLPYSYAAQVSIAAFSLLILWEIPLVLHPNKKHLYKKSTELIERSRHFVLIQISIYVFFSIFHRQQSIICTLSIAYALSAISRIIARIQHPYPLKRN
ncbi:MAG: accessory gene regulator B family protein [Faecousia sp.]